MNRRTYPLLHFTWNGLSLRFQDVLLSNNLWYLRRPENVSSLGLESGFDMNFNIPPHRHHCSYDAPTMASFSKCPVVSCRDPVSMHPESTAHPGPGFSWRTWFALWVPWVCPFLCWISSAWASRGAQASLEEIDAKLCYFLLGNRFARYTFAVTQRDIPSKWVTFPCISSAFLRCDFRVISFVYHQKFIQITTFYNIQIFIE